MKIGKFQLSVAYKSVAYNIKSMYEGINRSMSKSNHFQVIVEDTAVLMDSIRETGSSKYNHREGTTRYPFSFQLSPHLPSTFDGKYGSVRYSLKAKIEKSWKLDQV